MNMARKPKRAPKRTRKPKRPPRRKVKLLYPEGDASADLPLLPAHGET